MILARRVTRRKVLDPTRATNQVNAVAIQLENAHRGLNVNFLG